MTYLYSLIDETVEVHNTRPEIHVKILTHMRFLSGSSVPLHARLELEVSVVGLYPLLVVKAYQGSMFI